MHCGRYHLRVALLLVLYALQCFATEVIQTIAGGGYDGTNAMTTFLQYPQDVLADASDSGGFYIVDTYVHRIRRVASNGSIRTIAGTGSMSFYGDGGPATSASMYFPSGIAVDFATGDVYISEGPNRVRLISANGTINTIAGSAVAGFSGDGGLASAAKLDSAGGLHLDAVGRVLYVADTNNNRIRAINLATGIIDTVAGDGIPSYAGDGVLATSTSLRGPTHAVLDASRSFLYIADSLNNRIRRVDVATGIIYAVAGTGSWGYTGEGGSALLAPLANPTRISLDANTSTIYIAEASSNRVRRILSDGTICIFAGGGSASNSKNNQPAIGTGFYSPGGVSFETQLGSVLIADTQFNNIRRVVPNGTVLGAAGRNTGGYDDTGESTTISLRTPMGAVWDGGSVWGGVGNVYIADMKHDLLRLVSGNAVTKVGGYRPFHGWAGEGVPASTSSVFASPRGLFFDRIQKRLLIADTENMAIRCIWSSGIVVTLIGDMDGQEGYGADGVAATLTQLSNPYAVTMDYATNSIYVADTGSHRIRKVNAAMIISTVAGNGIASYSGDGGAGTSATLNTPTTLAWDGTKSRLFIADSLNNVIRAVWPNGTITTVLTLGVTLDTPFGVSYDSITEALYIADTNHHKILRVNSNNGVVVTAAGSGQPVFNGDGQDALTAGLYGPSDAWADQAAGKLFIVDSLSHRIRVVNITRQLVTLVSFQWPYARGHFVLPVEYSGCLWNTSLPAAPDVQFQANGYQLLFRLRMLNGTDYRVPCWLSSLSVNPASQGASCIRAGTYTCNMSVAVAGSDWRMVLQQVHPNGTVLFETMSADGAVIPTSLASISVLPSPSNATRTVMLYGAYFWPIPGVLPVVYNNKPCWNVALCNESTISATCDVFDSALFWRHAVMSLQVADYTLQSTTAGPLLSPPSVVISPLSVTWGSTITIASPFIGAAPVQHINITGGGATQPCFNIRVMHTDAVNCSILMFDDRWIGQPLDLSFSFNRTFYTYTLPGTLSGLSARRASVVAFTAPMLLSRSGGDMVEFGLPVPLPTSATYTTEGVIPPANLGSIRAWIGNASCPSCSLVYGDTIQCVTPRGALPSVGWTLEVSGLFNISNTTTGLNASVSHSPPSIDAATPAIFYLPPPVSPGPPTLLNLTLQGVGFTLQSSWTSMRSAYLGNALCVLTPKSDVLLDCIGWNASYQAALVGSGVTRQSLDFVYHWGSAVITLPGIVIAIVRPYILDAIPRELNTAANGVITIVGDELCASGLCASPADVTVRLGSTTCTSVVVLNASALECSVPTLPSSQLTWPAYPKFGVTVTNAAHVISSELVSVYAPNLMVSSNATTFIARVHTQGFGGACLWDSTNTSSSASVQAHEAGWSFGLEINAFYRECDAITLTPTAAPDDIHCIVSAEVVCTTVVIDAGRDWALVMQRGLQHQVVGSQVLTSQQGLHAVAMHADAASSTVWLDLDGVNFGFNIQPLFTPVVTWAGQSCGNVSIANASRITAVCNSTWAAASLYWTDTNVSLAVANQWTYLLTHPPLSRPLVTVSPAILTWGDTITLTGTALGLARPTNIWVYKEGTVLSPLPCVDIAVVTADSVQCNLRFIHEEWFSSSVAFSIQVPNTTAPWVISGAEAAVLVQRPIMTSLSAPQWLSRDGGDIVTLVLPQPAISGSEILQYGAPQYVLPTIRAWVDGKSAPSCTVIASTTAQCSSPSGTRPHSTVLLEISGCFNITHTGTGTMQVSFGPPPFLASTPSTLVLSDPTMNNNDLRNITFVGKQLTGTLAYLDKMVLGSTACAGLRVLNDTALQCMHWNATHEASNPSYVAQPAALLDLTFRWAGGIFSVSDITKVISRPVVTSIDPAYVQANTLITVYGQDLCPAGACTGPSDFSIRVGYAVCNNATVITPHVINCKVPNIVPALQSGFPNASLRICNAFGSCSTDEVAVIYPTSTRVSPASTLPDTFIPSDIAAPMPLQPAIRIQLVDEVGPVLTAATCRLSSLTLLASLQSLTGTVPIAITANGVAYFDGVIVVTSFDTAEVLISAACTLDGGGDALAPYQWLLRLTPLALAWCTPPPSKVQAQQLFPAFSLGLIHPAVASSPCVPPGAVGMAVSLPKIMCHVKVIISRDNDTALIRGADAELNNRSLLAGFSQVSLFGSQGSTYDLVAGCVIGSLSIPPATFPFSVTLRGCEPGTEPDGFFCNKCPETEFSLGGESASCVVCPKNGAKCTGGVLSLLDGFYQPPTQRGQSIGPNTELHPCYNVEACTLNRTSMEYGCLEGYQGPLCGVCDTAANYGRFGSFCRTCWPHGANAFFLFVIFAAIIALLTWVAIRKEGNGASQAAPALRILMTYIQAVGSLRAFRASGTRAYQDAMGWTETVSVSPFSSAAFQCILGWSYATQYVALIFSPLVILAIVAAIYTLFALASTIRLGGMDVRTFKEMIRSWWKSKRLVSTLVFVLSILYMPIISASLRTLDCYDNPIAGQKYLRVDLSVNCNDAEYLAIRSLAVAVLAIFGICFPVAVIWVLFRAPAARLQTEAIRAAYGFLYDGYRLDVAPSATTGKADAVATPVTRKMPAPRHWLWWEGVVLIRKGCIAAISVLVTDSQHQLVAAVLVLGSAAHVQHALQPYASLAFNRLELLSLLASTLTALLCAVLVYQPNIASDTQLSDSEWAITISLLVITLGTLLLIAVTWWVLQWRRTKGAILQLSKQQPDPIISPSTNKRARPGLMAMPSAPLATKSSVMVANPMKHSRASGTWS